MTAIAPARGAPATPHASRQLPRVLCVDDEDFILAALRRMLRGKFDVHLANAPLMALKMIDEAAATPFAVIVCDLAMPGVSGMALLQRARHLAPSSVRILLTGHANIDAAIASVNDGAVFRFLTKPCESDSLIGAVSDAAEHHRLAIMERELLEQTLHGSVKALADILTIVSPSAFARGTRLKRYVARVADLLGVTNQWEIEIAALLSQLGSVSLPGVLVEKLHSGRELSPEERRLTDGIPAMAASFIAEIPRLDAVREILLFQSTTFDGTGSTRAGVRGEAIPLGARILKVATDLDALEASGMAPHVAIWTLSANASAYDPRVLAAFRSSIGQGAAPAAMRQVRLGDVQAGMVFAKDVMSPSGLLLAARGQEVGRALTERLRHFWAGSLLDQEVLVIVPTAEV